MYSNVSVIRGKKYRITLLTTQLVRFEYDEKGIFEDRSTKLVSNRNFPPVKYDIWETEEQLEIRTEYLYIYYNKQEFSKHGLYVRINGAESGFHNHWHYGDSLRNLGGTIRTLDRADGPVPLENGLLSKDGISIVDDSDSFAIENGKILEKKGSSLDFYFFGYGRKYRESLKDFFNLTGKPPLLPRFVLGNWWSRFFKYSQESYKQLMEKFEEKKIPFSVAVIDMDWHIVDIDSKYGNGWTGFTWNKELFPDVKNFLMWLHQHNLYISLNIHPADGIRPYESKYKELAFKLGLDESEQKTIEFDVSNSNFMKLYFEEIIHTLEKDGIDFWWIDWQSGDTSRDSKLDPLWVLNFSHYQDSGKDGSRKLTFSRYAGVGSHRYPIGFSGDTITSWDSLDFQPYFTATASNIGYGWWSHDIGGHKAGIKDDELATRWVQFGVFSPIMRLHSSDNPFSGKEPWNFNLISEQTMTKFLKLRHELIPYLYVMNKQSHEEGELLIQPMYYHYPNIDEAYSVPNQYYFGRDFIVCPMTTKIDTISQTSKFSGWLPEGTWYDYFTGRKYKGNRLLAIYRGIEEIPIFVKRGSIIPLNNLNEFSNSVANPEKMIINIYRGESNTFTLWEDDGISDRPQEKDWAYTNFKLSEGKNTFTIEKTKGKIDSIPFSRDFQLRFFDSNKKKITILKNNIPTLFEQKYDETKNCLIVELLNKKPNDEFVIKINQFEEMENNTLEEVYNYLNKAHIEYDKKLLILNMLENNTPKHVISGLHSLNLSLSVIGTLVEILTAM